MPFKKRKSVLSWLRLAVFVLSPFNFVEEEPPSPHTLHLKTPSTPFPQVRLATKELAIDAEDKEIDWTYNVLDHKSAPHSLPYLSCIILKMTPSSHLVR